MPPDSPHVEAILASLDDTPPATIRALARALALSDGPLSYLGMTFECWADCRNDRALTGNLVRLRLRHWLRVTAPECDHLLERLASVDEPPWPTIRDALANPADPKGS